MSVIVFAWGNDARGDDGLGPALGDHIEARWPDVTLVTGYQLQIEDALNLSGYDVALFIDAGRSTPAPYRFYETAAAPGINSGSHALSPESLLDVAARIGVTAPPAFVLCVAGTEFELGMPLSAPACANLAAARAFLDRLLAAPDLIAWRRLSDPLLAAVDA